MSTEIQEKNIEISQKNVQCGMFFFITKDIIFQSFILVTNPSSKCHLAWIGNNNGPV